MLDLLDETGRLIHIVEGLLLLSQADAGKFPAGKEAVDLKEVIGELADDIEILAARLGKSLDYFLGDEPLAASKRLVFHRLAAEAASERRDWTVVRDEVTAALVSKPEKRERAALLRFLAQAEMNTGNREVAFDRIGEALSLIDTATDAGEVAHLLHLRGIAYGQIGQYVAAAEALESARDAMERHEVNDPRLRSRILVALGTAYRRLNRTACKCGASAWTTGSSPVVTS